MEVIAEVGDDDGWIEIDRCMMMDGWIEIDREMDRWIDGFLIDR